MGAQNVWLDVAGKVGYIWYPVYIILYICFPEMAPKCYKSRKRAPVFCDKLNGSRSFFAINLKKVAHFFVISLKRTHT